MGGSVDCSNGGSYGSWFMPTAVRVDCSAGGLYGSWFMPTAEVWFGWIGPMVFCMDLCQRLRFGSGDWSNGVLYGFMPTAEVWFGGLVQWCFVWILVYANGGSVDCSAGVLYGSWFMPTA